MLHPLGNDSEAEVHRLGLPLLLVAVARMEPALFLPASAQIGVSLLLHRFSQPRNSLVISREVLASTSLTPRVLACLSVLLLARGISWLGFLFPLLVIDFTNLDLVSSLRSFLYCGALLLALQFIELESLSVARGCAYLRLPPFVSAMLRVNFSLLAIDFQNADSLVALRSFTRISFTMLAPRSASLSVSLLLRSFTQPGFPVLVQSVCRPADILSALGIVDSGATLPLHASARPSFSLSACGSMNLGASSSIRSACQLKFLLIVLGLS